MAQNNCSPSNIYGPSQQTMFLGCSITGFSATAGWNEQTSEVTVELVQDTCAGSKIYWNETLQQSVWTDPDPGFVGLTIPIIGAPVLFRFGEFEFSGLVQSWEELNSSSGFPTYKVKVIDPRVLLEKSQIIINEYAGGVENLHNVINAFGYMESFGNSCPAYYQSVPGTYVPGNGNPDGTIFGSPADAYGGADTNANGTQWNQILVATRHLLCSLTPLVNDWSPYGRLAFRSPSSIGDGFGLMPADSGSLAYYFLDLEEVPTAPSYWRLDGLSTGILEAVSQICEDAGYDYYIELIPVRDSGNVLKFIKVRTVNRNDAPLDNAIDTFVANAGREVISFDRGRELRYDKTSTLVIGGPKQTFYQAFQNTDPEGDGDPGNPEADDMIVPYFGIDPDTGSAYLPQKDVDGYWNVTLKCYDLALQLLSPRYGKAIPTSLLVNERELIAAESGFDVWSALAGSSNTALWQAIGVNAKSIIDPKHLLAVVRDHDIDVDDVRPADFMAIRSGIFAQHAQGTDLELMQIAYAWIQKVAEEYYGRKYQVRVPFTCVRQDSESAQIIPSEEPSDGGWTEFSTVLGINNPSIDMDFFLLEDSRIGAFCRFENAVGIEGSNLSEDDFIANGTYLWSKISVDQQFVYADASTFFSPRVVIELPQPIKTAPPIGAAQVQWAAIVNLLEREVVGAPALEFISKAQLQAGNMLTHWALQTRAIPPNAVGFGMKSNVLTYGPWIAEGAVGPVEVMQEEGLVPWEYGGYTAMNAAGNATAQAGVTNQQVTEQGSITVAGIPTLPLGAELLASDAGGPFNGGGNNLIENRSLQTGTSNSVDFGYTSNYLWDGTYGPNVTDITVTANSSGFQTTYNIRVWSPKFGRFAKYNAERIKAIGRRRLEMQKKLRAFIRNRAANMAAGRAYAGIAKAARRDRFAKALNEGAHAAAKTPHEVFVGSSLSWASGEYQRTAVNSSPVTELPVEFDGYENKAYMSLDGLLRPFRVTWTAGAFEPTNLPCLSRTLISHPQTFTNKGAHPPVMSTGEGAAGEWDTTMYLNSAITNRYLDPFTKPQQHILSTRYTGADEDTLGHDIEIVGRGETPPTGSMLGPIGGYIETEDFLQSDYSGEEIRAFGLRGPLIISGWGYDENSFPIPNAADVEEDAAAGIFTTGDLQNRFLEGWLRKPKTWPTGPLDIRFDRRRGVWTIPQPRLVFGTINAEDAIGDVSSYFITLDEADREPVYNNSGEEIDPYIVGYNIDDSPLPTGSKVCCYYDPYEAKYRIIERQGASSTYVGTADAQIGPDSIGSVTHIGGATGTASIWNWSSATIPAGTRCTYNVGSPSKNGSDGILLSYDCPDPSGSGGSGEELAFSEMPQIDEYSPAYSIPKFKEVIV